MQSDWILNDLFGDEPEADATSRVPISSADELRSELEALATLEPRIVELEAPGGKWVRIGLGGPWAGFAILEDVTLPRPGSSSSLRMYLALAPSLAPCERIEFLCGQQPCTLKASALFPVAQVIDLVVGYYQDGVFPNEIAWES